MLWVVCPKQELFVEQEPTQQMPCQQEQNTISFITLINSANSVPSFGDEAIARVLIIFVRATLFHQGLGASASRSILQVQ